MASVTHAEVGPLEFLGDKEGGAPRMCERADNEASQRKLQSSPGMSLIGRAVQFLFFKYSDVKASTKTQFEVRYVRKSHASYLSVKNTGKRVNDRAIF